MRALWTLAALAALLAVGGAAPAAARVGTTEAAGYEVTCGFEQGREWFSGDILHIRGEIDTTRVVAYDAQTGLLEPRLTGTNTVVLNLNVNVVTGHGSVHGSTVLQPDGIAGAWETSYTGQIRDGVATLMAVGKGTGDLAGMRLRVELQSIDLADAPDLCGGGGQAASALRFELRP